MISAMSGITHLVKVFQQKCSPRFHGCIESAFRRGSSSFVAVLQLDVSSVIFNVAPVKNLFQCTSCGVMMYLQDSVLIAFISIFAFCVCLIYVHMSIHITPIQLWGSNYRCKVSYPGWEGVWIRD